MVIRVTLVFPDISGDTTMLAIMIVQGVLRNGCPHIPKVRLESLCDLIRAALSATSNTLSNLARVATGDRHD